MANRLVKCPYCGKSFNKDIMPYYKDGRRYYHIECWARELTNRTADQKQKAELDNYIRVLFNVHDIPPKIERQIKTFHQEYGYTYNNIKMSLVYYYEIKHGDLKKANGGIGIVPFIYEQARNYYYQIQINQNNNNNKTDEYTHDIVNIKIKNP